MSGASSECLADETLALFLDHRMTLEEHAAVEQHLDSCATCFELFAALAPNDTIAVDDARRDDDASPEAGGCIGRHVLLAPAGAGAMGVVWAAYDPELDRKVALKLVRSSSSSPESRGAQARLLREAQALARLTHPNVVTVHDVGTHGDRVWLAMEFVQGRTLDAWRDAEPRAWQVVLDVMIAAGQGLAAAHEAGLVHRDVKPRNIMVASDGRVLVMDFGLARAEVSTSERSTDHAGPDVELTRAGAVMGTPAYMAPEQHFGVAVDARTDQFGWCVSAWESLYGERPFGGRSLPELVQRVTDGQLRKPPPGSRVPTWVRRVLARGLAPSPEDRWPSLPDLLAELVRGRLRARRLRRGVAVAGLVAVICLAWGLHEIDRMRRELACERLGHEIVATWPGPDGETRTRFQQAVSRAGGGWAAVVADKTLPWLDDWATSWARAREETCVSHDVGGEFDADSSARADDCLADARTQFATLVDALSVDPQRKLVEKAVDLASALPPPSECSDVAELQREPAVAPEDRAVVDEIRAEVWRSRERELAGAREEALGIARGALERAVALGHTPSIVRARMRVAYLLMAAGDYAGAEASFTTTYLEAASVDLSRSAAVAARELVHVVGTALARHAEARVWEGVARAATKRLDPDEDGLETAKLLRVVANLRVETAELDEARALHERRMQISERLLGASHPEIAKCLDSLAAVEVAAGRYADAVALRRRALAALEEIHGSEHPDTIVTLHNLAQSFAKIGEDDEAIALFERVVAWHEHEHEHESGVPLAKALANLATLQLRRGELTEARARLERAVTIAEAALGPDHDLVGSMRLKLAGVLGDEGDLEQERELSERVLASYRRTLGPEHPKVAGVMTNLANTYADLGRVHEARVLHEHARTIKEKVLGVDHPDVGYNWSGLGDLDRQEGRLEAAREHYERAASLWERAGPEYPGLRLVLINLAEVALEQGDREARSVTPAAP